MAEITTEDLLRKVDEQAIGITRLQLQKEALQREVAALLKAIPPPPAPKPNRAERRKKKGK